MSHHCTISEYYPDNAENNNKNIFKPIHLSQGRDKLAIYGWKRNNYSREELDSRK